MFWDKKRFYHLACLSDTGKVREHNEDNFLFDGHILPMEHQSSVLWTFDAEETAEGCAFALFDGMGGEAAGELASYTAARTMKEYPAPARWDEEEILRLFEAMNRAVVQAKRDGRYSSIGSTATALFLGKDGSYLANLGDSPAYLFRDGSLRMIARLHTDAEMLARLGINRKPALTQFFGIDPEEFCIEPHVRKLELSSGDRLLLCSDGLTDMVPEGEIAEILDREKEPGAAVRALLNAALTAGGVDNITVILCDYV